MATIYEALVPGKTWRSGRGVPSNTVGSDGDFYLNTSTGDIYERAAGVYSLMTLPSGGGGGGGVTSYNGLTGAVTGVSSYNGATGAVTGVSSFNGRTGAVTPQSGDYTASQVGLGSVTNDAQLKRAASDFSSFTQKTTLVAGDIVLIEDSAAAGVKKYALVSALNINNSSAWNSIHNYPVSANAEDEEFDGTVGAAPPAAWHAWYTPITAESSYTSFTPTTGVSDTTNNLAADTSGEWQQGFRRSALTVKPKRVTLNAGGGGALNRTVISKALSSALPVTGTDPWFVYSRVNFQINDPGVTTGGDAFDEGYFFFSLAMDSAGAPDPANRIQIRLLRQEWATGNAQVLWTKRVAGVETTVATRFISSASLSNRSLGGAGIDAFGIGYTGGGTPRFYAGFCHGENWEFMNSTDASFGSTLAHAHWSMYSTGNPGVTPVPSLFHIDYFRRRVGPQ